jgi:hypothetical protein
MSCSIKAIESSGLLEAADNISGAGGRGEKKRVAQGAKRCTRCERVRVFNPLLPGEMEEKGKGDETPCKYIAPMIVAANGDQYKEQESGNHTNARPTKHLEPHNHVKGEAMIGRQTRTLITGRVY